MCNTIQPAVYPDHCSSFDWYPWTMRTALTTWHYSLLRGLSPDLCRRLQTEDSHGRRIHAPLNPHKTAKAGHVMNKPSESQNWAAPHLSYLYIWQKYDTSCLKGFEASWFWDCFSSSLILHMWYYSAYFGCATAIWADVSRCILGL